MARRLILLGFLALIAGPVIAEDHEIRLSASPVLIDSGFLKFVLPRFSLKTGVRVMAVPLGPVSAGVPDGADLFLGAALPQDTGTGAMPALRKGELVFYVALAGDGQYPQKAGRFVDWLLSEIGQRTVEQFTRDGVQVFAGVGPAEQVVAEVVFEGDIPDGEVVAYQKCGRCHVIGERNRMQGIGSTPSFGVVRAIPDWSDRFVTFFARAPHPAITQVEGLTEPFDISRPPPIVPIVLTQKEYEDLLAFVATVEPADLGAPLQTQ